MLVYQRVTVGGDSWWGQLIYITNQWILGQIQGICPKLAPSCMCFVNFHDNLGIGIWSSWEWNNMENLRWRSDIETKK